MTSDTPDPDRPELAEVVPDDFLDTWGASTYDEALKRAQRAETTSETVKKCPECKIQRVKRKIEGERDEAIDSGYYCENGHHFDDPVVGPPRAGGAPIGGGESDPFVCVDDDDHPRRAENGRPRRNGGGSE
jgi:hypothetical protein